jgi:mono/diheme cytochrome c family protein
MTIRRLMILGLAAGVWAMRFNPLLAEDEVAGRGREIAETHCSRCHAIGLTGESPLAAAPPFRVLHERYPVENLSEALAEGIVTGHPDMPEFAFEPPDIAHFIAYLKSLEQ